MVRSARDDPNSGRIQTDPDVSGRIWKDPDVSGRIRKEPDGSAQEFQVVKKTLRIGRGFDLLDAIKCEK